MQSEESAASMKQEPGEGYDSPSDPHLTISKRELVNSLTFTVHLATDKLLVTSYYSIAGHGYRVSVSQDDSPRDLRDNTVLVFNKITVPLTIS